MHRQGLRLSGTVGRRRPARRDDAVDAGDIPGRGRFGLEQQPRNRTGGDAALAERRIGRRVHGTDLHGVDVAKAVFFGVEVKLSGGGVAEEVVAQEVGAVVRKHLARRIVE